MKYFFDTEFKEGFKKPLLGKSRHYIDLISVGIVGEDGSEYYAISNEFDLKDIWNDKDTWVKNNVLKPIYAELCAKQSTYAKTYHYSLFEPFTLNSMKTLIKWHGKSNQRIAGEIICFIFNEAWKEWDGGADEFINRGIRFGWNTETPIEFFAYYADYDWVLFCSLFGRMIDLPNGFPMYCKDLKQIIDEYVDKWRWLSEKTMKFSMKEAIKIFTTQMEYPKHENEHNALDDAKWNLKLYNYLIHGTKK